MVSLGRPYHFEFYKDCLPQILPDPFLNTHLKQKNLTGRLAHYKQRLLVKQIHNSYDGTFFSQTNNV